MEEQSRLITAKKVINKYNLNSHRVIESNQVPRQRPNTEDEDRKQHEVHLAEKESTSSLEEVL
jgi:hypothetical protein